MTYWKFNKLYSHYKFYYDFKLSKQTYQEIEELSAHEGEFFCD